MISDICFAFLLHTYSYSASLPPFRTAPVWQERFFCRLPCVVSAPIAYKTSHTPW